MRPGRIKHKARARHRKMAVTCAGVSALTVMGGTAAFATGGGNWDPHPHGGSTLGNGGSAETDVEQLQGAFTTQLAYANTGGNDAVGIVGNVNLGHQNCDTDVTDGNLSNVDHDNSAGNSGGDCTNDATKTNTGTANGTVHTGNASAPNSAHTTVSQGNSGGSTANNTANDNTVTAEDGWASIHNGGDAALYVGQQSEVDTFQGAAANTGHNSAVAAVIGINAGSQSGSSNVSGGNIDWANDHNTAGNTGGNASNTSHESNTGTASANVTTGNATASNSSTTSVTQTNSGSASTTNTANGNTVTSH
ncbi:MAG TPA: hypothetical protein VGN59_06135 [Acidimicrobiia bacterium]|jgi:hypothetical protein